MTAAYHHILPPPTPASEHSWDFDLYAPAEPSPYTARYSPAHDPLISAPLLDHSTADKGSSSPDMSNVPLDMRHFAESATSGASTISSAVASPAMSGHQSDWSNDHGLGVEVVDGYASDSFHPQSYTSEPLSYGKHQGFVVPSMIDPYAQQAFPTPPLGTLPYGQPLPPTPYHIPASPASSHSSIPYHSTGPIRSDARRAVTWSPYPAQRAQSVMSKASAESDSDEHKTICPIASCRRPVRDVKSHMITHQNERPEKCPITSCTYHIKGFARKYDKNRHTLTHFKGTMVCDFCPGSGTPGEKSFNRTDVFKRHLQSVHSVEQTTPNARRKKPSPIEQKDNSKDVAATCRTCGGTFPSAQDLYDHIDECVLRVVQEAEPSEAVNEQHLKSVNDDDNVKAALTSAGLQNTYSNSPAFDDAYPSH